MILPALLVFIIFLFLSALFASSETAFIAANPYAIDALVKKGSGRGRIVKALLSRVDRFLATILIGNTLVNVAAASVSTFVFVSFFPEDHNKAVLLATLTTTVLLLVIGEINPKTFAAHHPLKVALLLAYPVRMFSVLFYPLAKALTLMTGLLFPQSRETEAARTLNEEEIKLLLSTGIRGLSTLRKKMISEALDIGSRPVKEIMVPRPEIKAVDSSLAPAQVVEVVLASPHSRFPVYRGRLDNIEGVLHSRDLIPYLVDYKDINLASLLRKPFFVPESASIEKVLLQMQENSVHLVFVVDEFGNVEGIVTIEDIIEEIVGDIQDEFDPRAQEWFSRVDAATFVVAGAAPLKAVNQRLPVRLPERKDYTTLAGFFLYEFERIPREGDVLDARDYRLTVERMNKRHISLVRLRLKTGPEDGR
jgi:putative hemolysin